MCHEHHLLSLLVPPPAGHETTAAVCTWTMFCLMQDERVERKVLAEIDAAVGDRTPGEPWLRLHIA
jgi:cytochrome P450